MIRIFLFFIFFLCTISKAQDPKNIISNENNTLLIEEESKNESENDSSSEIKSFINPDESYIDNDTEQVNDNNAIVVQDIPNTYSPWHGTLSSENNGLGWMMWGKTSFSLSKILLDRINPYTNSPTLRLLLKNIILSRAKSPIMNSQTSLDNSISSPIQENKLPYLEKKIFHLVSSGFNGDLDNLITSIPQDSRNKEFEYNNFYFRLNSFDVPYVCNNVSRMLTNGENLTFFRKALIVCKLILKKEEEAMLALELLENDIEKEDEFINKVLNYLENAKKNTVNSIEVNDDDSNLLKILSFYNYSSAKNSFKETPILFYKTIFDLRLFTKELQIESLEFLVNQGIYKPSLLIKEYNSFLTEDELVFYLENKSKKNNDPKLRAATFQLITNSVATTDRAKGLMKLWELAEEKNILKAISLITKNSIMSLSPDSTLNWFNLPAAKSLILSNEIEAAKKWIFFGTSDIRERASVDIKFCRLLMLMYLYDTNISDYRGQTLDINYYLRILKNDLNINEKDFLKFILTLNALGLEIPSEMWKIFFSNETFSPNYFKFFRNHTSSYFMLDNAVIDNNLAEAALLSIKLLQDETSLYKEMYSFYKGIKGLSMIGLESYARSFAMEENFDFLAK